MSITRLKTTEQPRAEIKDPQLATGIEASAGSVSVAAGKTSAQSAAHTTPCFTNPKYTTHADLIDPFMTVAVAVATPAPAPAPAPRPIAAISLGLSIPAHVPIPVSATASAPAPTS